MKHLRFLGFSIALATSIFAAAVPGKYVGDWLLVNGLVVLQITEDGNMTLRNTGAKGPITVEPDGQFTWLIADKPPAKGRIDGDRLFLKNDQSNSPKWTENLEFRRAAKDIASEVIEVALRQQTTALAALAKVNENSVRMRVLNNFRQLSAAADQHFLENGTNKARFDQLVGPEKYLKKLEPVDGEDYSRIDFNQDNPEFKVVTASGLTITYKR